jgi:acid phosphatase (class A)
MPRILAMKIISLLFLLPIAAHTGEPAPVTHDYYAEGAVDFRTVVPPPPGEDSIAGQADRELAILFDANRTPEQVALAAHFAKWSPFTVVADVLGGQCAREALPRTAAFFDKVFAETRPVILAAKENWNRRRPYDYNLELRPTVDKPATTSYPSGHSFAASVCTVLMSAALPEHAAQWTSEARRVRWSRLYGGAHYPNDVMAGKVLGEAVGHALLQSPNVQKALKEVRAEILALAPTKAVSR